MWSFQFLWDGGGMCRFSSSIHSFWWWEIGIQKANGGRSQRCIFCCPVILHHVSMTEHPAGKNSSPVVHQKSLLEFELATVMQKFLWVSSQTCYDVRKITTRYLSTIANDKLLAILARSNKGITDFARSNTVHHFESSQTHWTYIGLTIQARPTSTSTVEWIWQSRKSNPALTLQSKKLKGRRAERTNGVDIRRSNSLRLAASRLQDIALRSSWTI